MSLFFFFFFRFPANPFPVVVSSRATSWKLRGDTSWGVNECPRRCNLASINPSAGRRDVRPYDVSLIDVHEATSMPHLRRPLHEFLPVSSLSLSPSSSRINRFFSQDSIFIYLFLSEGSHRHRDTLASSSVCPLTPFHLDSPITNGNFLFGRIL